MDIELVEAARAGGAAQRDALVEAAWPDAYRLAYAMLRDKHAAEDAAQEACIELCRSIVTLRAAGAFRTWFYRIVVRRATLIRRRADRDTLPLVEEGVSFESDGAIDVWRALATLRRELRDVVVLRYFEDLNSREIASVLGIPDATVRFRLMSARRALRPLLDDETTAAFHEVTSHAV